MAGGEEVGGEGPVREGVHSFIAAIKTEYERGFWESRWLTHFTRLNLIKKVDFLTYIFAI